MTRKGLAEHLTTISLEERLYLLENIASHLANASRADEFFHLLTDYDFVESKISAIGIRDLINDYNFSHILFAKPTEIDRRASTMKVIQRALQNAAHILTRDKDQLASQLWGRLVSSQDPSIKQFLDNARHSQKKPWLCPITPTHIQAGGPLVGYLQGHTADVTLVAITPDGKKAVSASRDGVLKVWDLKKGELLNTLLRENDRLTPTNSLAITPDGKKAVSASGDGVLKVWDVPSGELLQTMVHEGVTAVAITPDGKRVISGSKDNGLMIWDLKNGRTLYVLEDAHNDFGFSVLTIASDGKRIICAWMGELFYWEIETGELLRRITMEDESWNGFESVSGDGRIVICTSEKGLNVWDIEKRKITHSLFNRGNRLAKALNPVAVSEDGKYAISSDADQLQLWNLDIETQGAFFPSNDDAIRSLIQFKNSNLVIVQSLSNPKLIAWNMNTGKEEYKLEFIKDYDASNFDRIVITDDDRFMLTCQMIDVLSDSSTLLLWDLDLKSDRPICKLEPGIVSDMDMTGDRQVVLTRSSNTFKSWDLKSGKELRCSKNIIGESYNPLAIRIGADGKKVLVLLGSNLIISDLEYDEQKQVLEGHKGPIRGMALTSNRHTAITASYDGRIIIWDLERGKQKQVLVGHKDQVVGVSITPEGSRAVSVSDDYSLKVWDIQQARVIASLELDFPLRLCTISSDGTHIAAGGPINGVQFINLRNLDAIPRAWV